MGKSRVNLGCVIRRIATEPPVNCKLVNPLLQYLPPNMGFPTAKTFTTLMHGGYGTEIDLVKI